MKIKKSVFNNIELILYTFCFIFAPPIVPKVNFIFIVFVYSVIQLMVRKKSVVKEVFIRSEIRKFCFFMILAYMYISIVIFFGMLLQNVGISNYIKTFYRFGLLIPITITCILYIIVRCREMKYDWYDFIYVIIKAGLIQACVSVAMFLNPSVKQTIVQIMFINTGDAITQNEWLYQRRAYAFSNSILDSFGYGTGIIATLPFFLVNKRGVGILWYIPILLVVPLLNSRTGLIIFVIGVVSVIPLYLTRSNIGKKVKLILLITLILFSMNFAYKVIREINPMTTSWVENGIMSLVSIFNVNTGSNNIGYTESTNNLFSESKWYVPGPIGLFFGTGHNVYEANDFAHSDVGYINDLWLGGLVGMFLFYSPLIGHQIRMIFQQKQRELRYLIWFLLSAFLVANVKGYMINYNAGMAITLVLSFSASYFNKKVD
jgi:hypothetical protein